jgi:ankyrin repeat protein
MNENENAVFHNAEPFPLRHAITTNNMEELRRHLDAGADPNTATESGTAALGLAVHYNRHEMVALLLEKGANPNIGVPESSPVMEAILNYNIPILKMLLDYHADIDTTDETYGESPYNYVRSRRMNVRDELRQTLENYKDKMHNLRARGRNMAALKLAMGPGGHLEPANIRSLPADPVSVIASMLSGIPRRTFSTQQNILKKQTGKSRKHRKTRKRSSYR